jgi:hypothetical protein
MNNTLAAKKARKRTDNPLRMIFAYQKQIASVVSLMDRLRDGERFDIEDMLNIALDDIHNLVPHLVGTAIIGRADDQFTCHAKTETEPLIMGNWSNESVEFQAAMNVVSENKETESVIFQNYEKIPTLFAEDFFEKQATSISWLCNLPDYEQLFMVFVRKDKKFPFLSHEIQAIKMLSRIIGSHLNYTCAYQNLLYNIHSDLL